MSFIEVRDVCKTFKVSKRRAGVTGMVANLFAPKFEKKAAVKAVSFDIEQGEMVGFIGPNGAGKSTTIKMLSGILHPDSGSINVGGYIPYKQRKNYVGRIGVVFGQKSQLQWDLPVIDSFELLKAIYSVPDDVYRKNLSRFTEMLDMSGFIDQPVRQLSLGQRMRADIVAALLHSPEIVFFDEPTIGVDVVGKETIRSFIRELNQQDNVTMIFTTHDMQDIEKTCKRLIIIDEGAKVYDGTLSGIREKYGTSRQLDVEFGGRE
ncbi:MAG: ATP-binding cassette domain-containing protein, partial [Oscillospiraceae bacterium]